MSRKGFTSSVVGTSGPLVFFLHGWPDTASDIYAKQIADLSKSYRCVLVESPWNEFTRERVLGPSFLDLYKGFDAVVESHRRADEKIILVAHDWGTMLALDYERKYGKQRVEKLVILDVFPEPSQKSRRPSLLLILLVLVYQSWLIVALLLHNYLPLVGQQLGNFMTYLCAYVFGAPCARNARKLSAVQNFYYLRFWQGFFGGEIKNLFPAHARENGGIRAPEVPLLFVHGSKKPVQFFHHSLLTDIDKRTDGSKHLSVPTGHWVTRSPLLLGELKSFFAAK